MLYVSSLTFAFSALLFPCVSRVMAACQTFWSAEQFFELSCHCPIRSYTWHSADRVAECLCARWLHPQAKWYLGQSSVIQSSTGPSILSGVGREWYKGSEKAAGLSPRFWADRTDRTLLAWPSQPPQLPTVHGVLNTLNHSGRRWFTATCVIHHSPIPTDVALADAGCVDFHIVNRSRPGSFCLKAYATVPLCDPTC